MVLRRLLRLKYSIKALLLFIAVAAVWTSGVVRRARDQRTAVGLIREHGGTVYYDFEERPSGSGRFDPKAESKVPAWLLLRLGEDFFSNVVCVEMSYGNPTAAEHGVPKVVCRDAAQHLRAFCKLRHLSFGATEVTDEILSHLGHLRQLESLEASRARRVTDTGIACLAPLHRLKSLVLCDSLITDDAIVTLSGLTALAQLELRGARITDRGTKRLGTLTKLKWLGVGKSGGISDKGLPSLNALKSLEGLDVSDADITASGIASLTSLKRLRRLDLSNNEKLSDRGAQCLTRFDQLEILNVSNTGVNHKGIEYIARVNKLRVLDVSNNPGVTNDGVAQLSHLSTLDELNLHNTGIGSLAIQHLSALPRLRVLNLSSNPEINVSAIPYLQKLAGLHELDLSATRVRLNAGNSQPLTHLISLEYLNLAETGSETAALQELVPQVHIIGSRAASHDTPEFYELRDHWTLTSELSKRERRSRRLEWKRSGLSDAPDAEQFIPSPHLLPPQETVGRMIAVAKVREIAGSLRIEISDIERIADLSRWQKDQVVILEEKAEELDAIAKSNTSIEKLYEAAVDFGYADLLYRHLEYLEEVRDNWGLTDVEEHEHQESLEFLNTCLREASERLGVAADPSADDLPDAIIRVWKDTQRIVDESDGKSARLGNQSQGRSLRASTTP